MSLAQKVFGCHRQDGELDAHAFAIRDTGGGIRDVVAQLRIAAGLAERLYDQWHWAGARDVVVTPGLEKAASMEVMRG